MRKASSLDLVLLLDHGLLRFALGFDDSDLRFALRLLRGLDRLDILRGFFTLGRDDKAIFLGTLAFLLFLRHDDLALLLGQFQRLAAR